MSNENAAEAGTPIPNAGEPNNVDLSAAPAAGTSPAPANPEGEPAKPAEGEQKPVVPETYTFTMPEGVELDQDAATDFSAFAKELGLTQEQAQKGADIAAQMQQRQVAQHAQTVESWISQVKADKEIGGDKLAENLAVAQKALDAFGSQELKNVLVSTGLGNHPAIIRAFYRAGMKISEDGQILNGAPTGGERDMAKKMFPNMN